MIETAVKLLRENSLIHSFIHQVPPIWSYCVPGTLCRPFLFCESLCVVLVHFICHRWNIFIFFPKLVTVLLSLQKQIKPVLSSLLWDN